MKWIEWMGAMLRLHQAVGIWLIRWRQFHAVAPGHPDWPGKAREYSAACSQMIAAYQILEDAEIGGSDDISN